MTAEEDIVSLATIDLGSFAIVVFVSEATDDAFSKYTCG